MKYTHAYDGKDFRCRPSDSGKLHEIKVTMANVGSDTIRFWMMTCSRSDYFITNLPKVAFCQEACRSNFPVLRELPPFKQSTFFMTLSAKSAIDSLFKIGFISLSEEEVYSGWEGSNNAISKKAAAGDVVWSSRIGSAQ